MKKEKKRIIYKIRFHEFLAQYYSFQTENILRIIHFRSTEKKKKDHESPFSSSVFTIEEFHQGKVSLPWVPPLTTALDETVLPRN